MALDHPLSPDACTYAVLDANTLLAPRLADVLFDLHGAGLYLPRWTDEIESGFLRNWARVVKLTPKVAGTKPATASPANLAKAEFRLSCFRAAVGEEYAIHGYDRPQAVARVPRAVLKDDVHVIAAPATKRLGIEVVSPGEFIDLLFAAAPSRVGASLENTVADLTNPPYTKTQLLDALKLHGAVKTVRHLRDKW